MARYENIQIFQKTLQMCVGNQKLKESIKRSLEGQKIYWEKTDNSIERGIVDKHPNILLSQKRTMEAARAYEGKRVCILNFASSVTPGGGVTMGCRAQEESLCRISTLYAAINDKESVGAFYNHHKHMIFLKEMGRKNNDDCIFTPGVVVFREDTFDCDILPEESWYSVDVITCAAPDQRYDETSAAYHPTDEELFETFKKRIIQIFDVAADNEEEVLILGAFGCGAFANPPHIVAKAFESVIEMYGGWFDTIEFAVYVPSRDSKNFKAFEIFEEKSKKL